MTAAPVTVIIPARNAAGTVRLALKSTLQDLGRQDRVIITDDGSTDATSEVIQSVADHRVELRQHDNSRGLGKTLNAMLADVGTPLVARMDADDIVIPGRFRRQRAYLTRDDVDVIFGSIVNFGRSVKSFAPGTLRTFRPAELRVLHAVINPTAHPTMLARTQAILDVDGYRESAGEDLDLWYRLHTAGRALAVRAFPVLLYRLHPMQVSGQENWRTALKHDPLLSQSHHKLMLDLGWEGPACWAALQQPHSREELEALHPVKRFLINRADSVSDKAGHFVRLEFKRRGI